MTISEQNQLIADLARDLVVQTAPQELPLFRATSTAYFKSPDKVLKNTKGKEETHGSRKFGRNPKILIHW